MQVTDDNTIVRLVENAAARNLLDYVRAAQIVAPGLGATADECAGGIAAFLGRDSPLTTVKGAGPRITSGELERAEDFFRQCASNRAVFELAPWVLPETIDGLRTRGYDVAGTEDIVAYTSSSRPRALPGTNVVPLAPAEWPELMLEMNGAPSSGIWQVLAESSAIIDGAMRFAVLDDDVKISCAELFGAGEVGIFANDATLESARKRGAQTATIQERIRIATAAGFALLIAEVAPGSASERNYLRCGFSIAYTRTHFARPLD